MRAWLVRLALIAIGLATGVVLVEAGLQVWDLIEARGNTGPDFEGAVFEFCAPRHHCLIPNGRFRHVSAEFDYLWTNNALGMRDSDHPRQKPSHGYRIVILGDSMIQGHGVGLEDTMVRRLEASLNQPPRTREIEVLNAGVFGYSPLIERLYLHDILDTLAPDLVIVGITLENDVGEDRWYAARAHVAADGAVSFSDREWPWTAILEALPGGAAGPPAPPPDWRPSPAVRGLLYRSHVFMLLKRLKDERSYPRQREREFALVQAHRSDIGYDLALVNYPVLSRDERLKYWELPLEHLAEMAALCRAHEVPLILLVIPPVQRLDGETDFAEPYDVLEDFGRRVSLPVIELLPDFLGHDPYALYYRFDHHWTPEGNRVAAAVVDRELRRLGALPGEG